MSIYTAEKALKDNEAKIPAELKDSVNAKITALRGVKDLPAGAGGTDGEAIKKATEELSAEMSKIGEAISKATAEAGQAGPQEAPKTPEEQNEEVKEAEVKEEKGPEGETPKA